jgi:hypothetical protein
MKQWKEKIFNSRNARQPGDERRERRPLPITAEEKQTRFAEIPNLGSREVLVRIVDALGDKTMGNDTLRKALMLLEGLELEDIKALSSTSKA